MNKAIMLKSKDKRKFFTHQNNLPLLIEFIKTFNLDVISIEIEQEKDLLELETLATSFCDANYVTPKLTYKAITQLYPKIEKSNEIKNFINKTLLDKKEVSLTDLKSIYSGMPTSSLSNYYSQIRKKLNSEGYILIKTGVGKYKITE